MTREVCEVCTGSYTGEFSPKWKGPWAKYFSASGEFLTEAKDRIDRLQVLRAGNRVSLGDVSPHY